MSHVGPIILETQFFKNIVETQMTRQWVVVIKLEIRLLSGMRDVEKRLVMRLNEEHQVIEEH